MSTSSGLVYMRPLKLAGIATSNVSEKGILEAWGCLTDWIARKSIRRDVEIGYGLLSADEDGLPVYTACIELPMAVSAIEARELMSSKLGGGAYMRCRYTGPVCDIDEEFMKLGQELGRSARLRRDDERPQVTVFLDAKAVGSAQVVRSNLLIPVRRTEVAESCAA